MIKKLTLAIVMVSFVTANIAEAQSVHAHANATALVIRPLSITHITDMRFGRIAVNSTAGTVKMAPVAGSGGRTRTGGVSLPVATGTVSSARFTIAGGPSDVYHITLPAGTATLSDGAGHTMSLGSWTDNFGAAHALPFSGTESLFVGATLSVGSSQVPGNYATSNVGGSGVFSVYITY